MLFGVLKDDVLNYFKKRTGYAAAFVILLCVVLLGRLAYLQIVRYDELVALSENNRIRMMSVRADRGFIKDRNGQLLVKNAPGYELEVIKEDVPNVEALLNGLSAVVNIDKDRVMQRMRNSYVYEPVKVARGVGFEQLSYLMEYSSNYSGIQFVADPTRSYLDGNIFCHILGYLGEASEQEVSGSAVYKSGDIIGKSGIEKEFDLILRGRNGTRQVEVDSVGRVIEILNEEASIPGKNVIMTLDYQLQKYIADLMVGRAGSAVVLNMKDNSVLAMYSAPTYNLDMFSPFISDENWQKLLNDQSKPLLNRPIEGAYPPGSVFKVVIAAAALSEGIITPSTKIYCPGWFRATPRTSIVHNCWKHGGHGEMDLRSALSESCDVYFYNVGYMLGIDKINEYATALSLGGLTGISLPNEKSGLFPSQEWKQRTLQEAWYPGETVNVSIGQGYVTSTPLQVAVMYSSLFNGGRVFSPRIVHGIEDPETGEVFEIPPNEKEGKYIKPEIVDVIMEGLQMAVEDNTGTSWRARVPGLHLGGKTGTAQVVSLSRTENMTEDEIPENWRDHSWFAGVYPTEEPSFVVVVMLEHGGSGGRSSAPLAGQIMQKMMDLGYVSNR